MTILNSNTVKNRTLRTDLLLRLCKSGGFGVKALSRDSPSHSGLKQDRLFETLITWIDQTDLKSVKLL